MSQPSFLASGTTPLRSDTKSRVWAKILGTQQNRTGASAVNDPKRTDTLWRTKYKLARSMAGNGCPIGSGSGGGSGGGGTGDPDVDAFLLCSGITDATIVAALVALVTSLKNNGLWTGMDAIYPFVGGLAIPHSCNLRNTANYSITWHGSVTHDANGVTGDGSTGYGDTGFNAATAGGNYVLNSASLGVYCKTEIMAATTWPFIGVNDGTNQSSFGMNFSLVLNPDVKVGGLNSVDTNTGSDISDFRGTCIISRTSNTAEVLYNPDGTTNSITSTSTAIPSFPFFILSNDASGSPSGFGIENLAFAFIGAGLTGAQVTTLKNTILTFQNALGRA